MIHLYTCRRLSARISAQACVANRKFMPACKGCDWVKRVLDLPDDVWAKVDACGLTEPDLVVLVRTLVDGQSCRRAA